MNTPTAETEALQRQVAGLSALLDIEREARDAATPEALFFVIVNRSRAVLPYGTAALWTEGSAGIRIDAVSAVSLVDQGGPFAQWLIGRVHARPGPEMSSETGQWSEAPPEALWCPLAGTGAGFVLFRAAPWQEAERRIALRLSATYAHALKALGRRRQPGTWRRPDRKRMAAAAVLAALVLAFPVRQSAVAPATIVARAPLAVTAPVAGVIAEIAVQPYAPVAEGQVLVRFDPTMARGRLQQARDAERVAAADLLKTRQRAFSDADAGAKLNSVAAQLDLQRSEAAYAEDLLERTQIKAERAGLALFDDPEDWTGKPVAVGERIMVLADPEAVMLEIQLPADDVFVLGPGAEVAFSLNIDPLGELTARLTHVAYEAKVGPEGFLAYRLTAEFTDGAKPRIGLKGVATVYGERVSLARFFFRRPLAALRRSLAL